MSATDGDEQRGEASFEVGVDPVHRADYRNMVEEPWAGTGGLSELLFSYFMLAIFISYVILLTWLREGYFPQGILHGSTGKWRIRLCGLLVPGNRPFNHLCPVSRPYLPPGCSI